MVRRDALFAIEMDTDHGPIDALVTENEELAAFTAVTNAFGPECVQFVPTAKVHHYAPAERCGLGYVLSRSKAEGISKE